MMIGIKCNNKKCLIQKRARTGQKKRKQGTNRKKLGGNFKLIY